MTYKNYLIYEEDGKVKITDHIGTIVIDEELLYLLNLLLESNTD